MINQAPQPRRHKPRTAQFVVLAVFLVYTIVSFGIYCARVLDGKIDNHILAAEMFGTPADLAARGVKPLYQGAGVTGWDGQFYYYMSNDILGRGDTPKHIDATAYRYQRIGLSLYAATVATLAGRDWVSPKTFIFSYLLLLMAATWAGARLLSRLGAHPSWILLWSLSVGTQITLFNALPDAAADAFLILALSAAFSGRLGWSVIPFTLSGLSREVYALFPSLILVFALLPSVWAQRRVGLHGVFAVLGRWNRYYWLAVPALIVVAWQVYVVRHFGVSPSSQAHGILGLPLASWFKYLASGLQHNHLLVGSSIDAYFEAASLLLFLAVLSLAVALAARTLRRREGTAASPEVRGIAAGMLVFCALYTCFGPTVMMHYTGYFKALAVFFFLIPLLLALAPVRSRTVAMTAGLLLLAVAETTVYNFRARLLPFNTFYAGVDKAKIQETKSFACLADFNSSVRVRSVDVDIGSAIVQIFGRGSLVAKVELSNLGNVAYVSSPNVGGVFMSYQWVDAKGNMIQDGERFPLAAPLLPGQTVPITIHSYLPTNIGGVTLKISPVQEGCAWFYLVNPSLGSNFNLRFSN